MNLSLTDLHLLAPELRALLVPSRIQKVFDSVDGDQVFQLRAPGQTHHLFISLTPKSTRIHLIDKTPQRPKRPTGWTMLLRKWLHGAWIESIDVAEDDRIVTFHLNAVDPAWEPTDNHEKAPRKHLLLVLELFGTLPNVFLLTLSGSILGSWRNRSLHQRPTSPGAMYVSPPPPPDTNAPPDPHDIATLPAKGARSSLLEQKYRAALRDRAKTQLRTDLTGALKQAHQKARRLVKNIESDLETIEDASQYRKFGELLQSAYGKVDRGQSSVRVPDFYVQEMPAIEIPLDPSKNLQENITRYFHQYRRFSEARDSVEARLLEAMANEEELGALRDRLRALDTLDELTAFNDEHQILRSTQQSSGTRKRQPHRNAPLPPYRTFRSRQGNTILVGRGARYNDELTTSVARGRDLWLHARDWAGAHVLLRMNRGDEPHPEDMLDAATLAAFYSKGKDDTLVDITYTRAKYVRKPPGASPGLVTIANGSTLGLRIDEKRLQRLMENEE